MHGIFAIAKKDIRLLLRDWFGLFWILAFPLIMAIFFGSLYGGSGGKTSASEINLLTIDLDQSADSKAFLERLDNSDAAKIVWANPEALTKQKDLLDYARNQVQSGNYVAFLVVQKGFAKNKKGPLPNTEYLKIGIDPSHKAEGGFLQGILMEASFSGMQDQFSDSKKFKEEIQKWTTDLDDDKTVPLAERLVLKNLFKSLDALSERMDPAKNPKAENVAIKNPFASMKLEMEEVEPKVNGEPSARSGYEISFPSAMSWAIIGCVASFVIGIVNEKNNGTYMRLRVAPITRVHLLGGKALASFFACAGAIVLLLLFGLIVFKIRILNYPLLAMAIVCSSLCYVGIAMLISVIGRTERSVSGAVWGINMPCAMLGGGMIPLAFMPPWMTTASSFTPTKWVITSLEGAVWRGFTFTQMLFPCAILLAIGAITFAIAVFTMIKRDE